MTIQNTVSRNQYTGNGAQTTFTYSFEIFDEADIEVYVGSTLKTITTDYTVTDAGEENGGTIVFVSAPANGATVTFIRSTTRERTVDYQPSGAFKAAIVNNDFDRLIAIVQELDLKDTLALKINPTDPEGTETTLPVAADRANKALIFDSVGAITVSDDDYNDQLADVTAQADAAATSASAAASSASAAATSATNAANSASAAATSETNAANSAIAAAASAVTAASSINISTTDGNSSDTTMSVVLVASQATGNQAPHIDSGLTYNASTDALTATTFVGALSGNATTATNATNINISTTDGNSSDTTMYVVLVGANTTGNQAPHTDIAGISYNASTNVLSTTASAAQYSDLAERYLASAGLPAGTIVSRSTNEDVENEIEVTSIACDKRVFGVVSTAPAYLMNDGHKEAEWVPIALTGRVPVRVHGPVKKGQLIVSSHIEGVAQAIDDEFLDQHPSLFRAVIGHALHSKVSNDVDLVECFVKAQA